MAPHQPFTINPPRRHASASLLQVAISVIAAVLLAIFLNLFVFQSYYVDGESMSPTLHTNDRLIISKVGYSISKIEQKDFIPNRGDIIVIDGNVSPQTVLNAPHLIKRVIGLPGDEVVISGGKVMIYNKEHPEGFDANRELSLNLDPTFITVPLKETVPDGKVFVLGDNRGEGGSYDSRAFGFVESQFIQGQLWARILPLSQGRVF